MESFEICLFFFHSLSRMPLRSFQVFMCVSVSSSFCFIAEWVFHCMDVPEFSICLLRYVCLASSLGTVSNAAMNVHVQVFK